MLNKVQLIGNVGADPEIRSTNNGGSIANLRVATSESWVDKRSGDRQTKTEWHTVVVFNDKLVEIVEKYISKGDKVYVEGKLQTRKWEDKDGNDRYSTEIVISGFDGSIKNLSPRGDDEDGDRGGSRRGGSRSRDRDDDDRGGRSSGRSNRDRDDDRGSRGKDRDDDRGSRRNSRSRDDDDRGGNRSSRNTDDDMNDDIPF